MSQCGAARHDGGLVDGHGVFGEVGHDGVSGLVVRCDGLVLLVDLHAPPLRAWGGLERNKRGGVKDELSDPQASLINSNTESFFTHQDLVLGKLQVFHGDHLFPVHRRLQGRLVHQVLQLRPRETHSTAGNYLCFNS